MKLYLPPEKVFFFINKHLDQGTIENFQINITHLYAILGPEMQERRDKPRCAISLSGQLLAFSWKIKYLEEKKKLKKNIFNIGNA